MPPRPTDQLPQLVHQPLKYAHSLPLPIPQPACSPAWSTSKPPESFITIGSMPSGYHITVDPYILPVQHRYRWVPRAMGGVKKLSSKRCITMGIIIHDSTPTSCISSLIYPRKANGSTQHAPRPRGLKLRYYPWAPSNFATEQDSTGLIFSQN